jgi:uncharacterized Zn finger protein
MFISKLSEFTIRRHANAKSCQKGEVYYEAGAVINIIQRANILQAEVQGNAAKPYYVNLNLDDHGLTAANCTCDYSQDGWCKHIVATMLVCIRQPETIAQRPTLAEMLDGLSHDQIHGLLQELVAEHPQLMETIDQHVRWIGSPISERKKDPFYSIIDVAPFRRQVQQILADGLIYGQNKSGSDDLITKELLGLVQSAVEFSERGEGRNAIALLAAITSTCVANWHNATTYASEQAHIAQALNQAWCEAILSTELTPEEKVDLQINLTTWQDNWRTDFSLSLAALHQDPVDPDWLIRSACSQAESIINAGKSQNYPEAIRWLEKARTAYIESGRQADWSSYLASLIQIHGRKRKLIAMLKVWNQN